MDDSAGDFTREDLCKHERSTTGCVACRLLDYRIECDEALVEQKKCFDAVVEADTRLQGPEALDDDQSKSIADGLVKSREQAADWDERLLKLNEAVVLCLESVQIVRRENKPEMWTEKFQEIARSKASHQDNIFRAIYTDNTAAKFQVENPSSAVKFAGLDRSKIPATADCLLSEGTGLELFLRAGRYLGANGTARLPTTAVGEHLVPAFMSPGRAIRMFKLPEDPGDNPEDTGDENNDRTAALADELQSCSVSPAPFVDETPARTEREYQGRDVKRILTSSTLTEEEQWMKLDRKKYMAYTSLLASKYNKLASTPVVVPKTTSDNDPEEGSAEQSADSGASLFVANPDFAGFAEWIADLESAYPKNALGLRILPKWKDDSDKRDKKITAKLKGALSKMSITNEMLGMKSPSDFNNQLPLLKGELEALKFKFNKKK